MKNRIQLLFEQVNRVPESQVRSDFDNYKSVNGGGLNIPKGSEVVKFKHPIDEFAFGFDKWRSNYMWDKYAPTVEDLNKLIPKDSVRMFTTPDGIRYTASLVRIQDDPPIWRFNGYHNPNGQPFGLVDRMKTLWEKYGLYIQIAASLIAAILTAGQSVWIQLAIQAGIDLLAASWQYFEGKDTMGAAISLILACIPFSSKFFRIGHISNEVLSKLIGKFSSVTTKEELEAVYKTLTKEELIAFNKVFSNQKEELVKETSKILYNNIKQAISDGTIDLAKIPVGQRQQVRDLLYQLGMSAGVVVGAAGKQYYDVKQGEKAFQNLQQTFSSKPMGLTNDSGKVFVDMPDLENEQ